MEAFCPPWKPHRVWTATDATFVSSRTFYAGTRPRGVLSGLFVITVPSAPAHFHSMGASTPIRIRLNDSFYTEGGGPTVFLAYEHEDSIMLEDVLVWKGREVWSCETFRARWEYFDTFLKEWAPDSLLQGFKIMIAAYTSLASMKPPGDGRLIELIPNQARQKRLILMLEAGLVATSAVVEWIATRETARGPDVYSVMKKGSTESEGIACVQSLAVSRALRLVKEETFRVECTWHERFKKWEITGVI